MDDERALVLLAAGGTGGHLFPAEALSRALARRGAVVHLATDERATRYGEDFPAAAIHVIPSATLGRRNPLALARTAATLGYGFAKAYRLLGRIRPAVAVGFGGYPTLPPMLAASVRGIPTVIHDANAVMGRANRLLSRRVTAIATSFPGVLDREPDLAAKETVTGNPLRPAVIAAAAQGYAREPAGPFNILVFGGSQGARVMAQVVPPAIELLPVALRAHLSIVQQARGEDLERVRATYAGISVAAEVAPFFSDLPQRMAAAHLVVSRSGAGAVAELAAIGRPSILVPLPHALDQDQLANASVLETAGGAILMPQSAFTTERLAQDITALAADPSRLAAMAAGAKAAGRIDAAERLADLVLRTADMIPASR
jgi:UDP-N-acetylglucosamine--N-acetylmuramyl-(pentapeptide) pyrophosphoryl-undecaprenol N-acetylglucosamine transferase